MRNDGMITPRSEEIPSGGGSYIESSINTETLAATKTLVVTDLVFQWFDPDGADRDVNLPAEADSADLIFFIYNTANSAGENLIIKNDSSATIATLGPRMLGIFGCNGTDWKFENDLGIFYDAVNEKIGIGVLNPDSLLQIKNDSWLSGKNFADTAAVNMFKVDANDEIIVGGTLVLGATLEFTEDNGPGTRTDMPVSTSAVAGAEMSYTDKVDGDNGITVYAEADGAGGIQNPKIIVHSGLNLKEITTPTAKADYGAIYTKTDNKLYFQDGGGTEHEVRVVGSFYGEMYLDNNGNATVIETANTPIMVRNCTTGSLSNFTFNAGSTGAITAFSDGTGKVNVASAGHGRVTGDDLSIRGTTNYSDIWTITRIDDNNFSIPATWVANDGASDWDEGSYLLAGTGSTGKYTMTFNISASEAGGAGSNVTARVYINSTKCDKCSAMRKYSNNDYGNLPGTAILDITESDKLYFTIESTGTNDITCKYGNLNIFRL